MGFLKKLFGGGGGGQTGDPKGIYFYVQPNGCEEVVRVRIDRNNDLSLTDDGTTYWVRKLVRGVKCRQMVEMELHFNEARQLIENHVKDGVLVDEAAYQAWVAEQEAHSVE